MSIPAGAAGRPAALPETPPPAVPGAAGVRRVLHNALSLLLAYVLPRLFMLGSVVVAARVLGTAQFGAYSTAAAFAVVLSIIATLGMTPLLVREIARAPERAPGLLAAAHAVKTASNVLMLALLLVLARYVMGYPAPVVLAALLLGVSYAVGAYTENLAAWFQAVERMHVWTQASAINGVVAGGLGLALVVGTRNLAWFCVAPILGQLGALAWLAARLPKEARQGGRIALAEALRLARALAPFAAAFVALTVYYKVDVLLLARWRDAAEVGTYAAAYKLVDVAQALALVVAGAVYPRLSRAVAAGAGAEPAGTAGAAAAAADAPLPAAAARLSEWMLLAVAPAAGLVFLLREPLIAVVYGHDYAEAAAVLGWLAAVLPALALNILAGYILGAAGLMRRVAGAYVLGTAANVAANAALIPRYGAVGAGMAMLGSEVFLAGVLIAVLRSRGAAPAVRWLAAACAPALACAAAAALVGERPALAAAGYALAVGVLYRGTGVLAREDLRLLAQALGVRRRMHPAEAQP
jgi:O-antigen/teichoic acid export membrane protein